MQIILYSNSIFYFISYFYYFYTTKIQYNIVLTEIGAEEKQEPFLSSTLFLIGWELLSYLLLAIIVFIIPILYHLYPWFIVLLHIVSTWLFYKLYSAKILKIISTNLGSPIRTSTHLIYENCLKGNVLYSSLTAIAITLLMHIPILCACHFFKI